MNARFLKSLVLVVSCVVVLSAAAAERTLEKALELAGENRAEMEEALAAFDDERAEGMRFLIRYMPERDLSALDADLLVTNVKLGYQARQDHEWAQQVPQEIFFNDVLPYASLSESREDWRTGFYAKFAPMVEESASLRDAMITVNQKLRDAVEVDYNTKRKRADQSPSESMEIKMASCTGLSILLVDALRSVGIPARVAGTPAWTTKQGNHNWVEFYDPETGKWHFTEYYMDAKGVDHGWLLADAAMADDTSLYHAVYASSWKHTGHYFPLVWDLSRRDVAAVKLTARYQELAGKEPKDPTLCDLRIDLTDGEKREAVAVYVVVDGEVVASGETPGATADMNQFLTVPVKRGAAFEVRAKEGGDVLARGEAPEQRGFERVAIKRVEE
ncbi:transglutaminase-like domain-containing protein [Sulfuriroseicoccus oceanibius]|uniref:Transglutaminase domain-containing protein n=1 Tax=Sulfuriroseicoccus oceanibius TaxID=2707525 RepID=A0A7T7F0Y9_9BACT|nr:transglutaminase-like domain-containing protein [Sulfuriroseicoccus oceanibius]QQL44684.1 transglutaminase domain-containing protein [Sulfuriroseicoccus oceanibius]